MDSPSLLYPPFPALGAADGPGWVSRLCIADKLAFVMTPAWLYLPMARATGELDEYIAVSRMRQAGDECSTELEESLISSTAPRSWFEGITSYTRRWIGWQRWLRGEFRPVVAFGSEAKNKEQHEGPALVGPKSVSLTVCLFVVWLIVFGQVLRTNELAAFLAAACATPLAIHVFNRIGPKAE